MRDSLQPSYLMSKGLPNIGPINYECTAVHEIHKCLPTAECLDVCCCPARNVASIHQWNQLGEIRSWIPGTIISNRNRIPKCLPDLAPHPDPVFCFPSFRHWTTKLAICTSCTPTVTLRRNQLFRAWFSPTLDLPIKVDPILANDAAACCRWFKWLVESMNDARTGTCWR